MSLDWPRGGDGQFSSAGQAEVKGAFSAGRTRAPRRAMQDAARLPLAPRQPQVKAWKGRRSTAWPSATDRCQKATEDGPFPPYGHLEEEEEEKAPSGQGPWAVRLPEGAPWGLGLPSPTPTPLIAQPLALKHP